jgi:predicted transcriptional regulator YdeE
MDIQIKNGLELTVYGYGGFAPNKNWGEVGMGLMNKMWEKVKGNNLKNKGINIWVYEPNLAIFAGVELESAPPESIGLEMRKVSLKTYAVHKHIGPYNKISESMTPARDEMAKRGLKPVLPYLEIYGHWDPDESKLETDMIWKLE